MAVLVTGGAGYIGGVTAESLTLETGVYWVEWSAGELVLYRMPEYRGDSEEWIVAEGDPPAWYVEPALYKLGGRDVGTVLARRRADAGVVRGGAGRRPCGLRPAAVHGSIRFRTVHRLHRDRRRLGHRGGRCGGSCTGLRLLLPGSRGDRLRHGLAGANIVG